jgi:hypothetical protein
MVDDPVGPQFPAGRDASRARQAASASPAARTRGTSVAKRLEGDYECADTCQLVA